MNEQFGHDSPAIEVSDFGPIIEARLDLRPLTVFVGQSNTGKSYLATLIYALHRYFSGLSRHYSRLYRHRNELPQIGVAALAALAEQLVERRDGLIAGVEESRPSASGKGAWSGENIALPEQVVNIFREGSIRQANGLAEEICRCFGIDNSGALVRRAVSGKAAANIVVRKHDEEWPMPVEHRLTIGDRAREFKATMPEGFQMRVGGNGDFTSFHRMMDQVMKRLSPEMRNESSQGSDIAATMLGELFHHSHQQMLGPLASQAFYLPAARAGVMQAHNVVVGALIQNAATVGLRNSDLPMLAGVLADFLERLTDLDRYPFQSPMSPEVYAASLEKAILGGSVQVRRSEISGYPRFVYQPAGWKGELPLMHASSMVSELAPIVLFLRHAVISGSVLMIEEPEASLHPGMQVELTRQLAMLIERGVRVIITTHSEWILEELANVVRRSQLPDTERERRAHGNAALNREQVGVWLFQQKNGPRRGPSWKKSTWTMKQTSTSRASTRLRKPCITTGRVSEAGSGRWVDGAGDKLRKPSQSQLPC